MSQADLPPHAHPFPSDDLETVLLAHGGGGRHAHQLLETLILPALTHAGSGMPHDSAVLQLGTERIAFTTDSFVVRPLFFPGGDIATLAVNGTVNDLAMCGASPLFLSVGMIMEEGFPIKTLRNILSSLRRAADEAEVRIVTGDTKVVEKGHGDGLYMNTSGIGVLEPGINFSPERIEPGDAVLVSNDIGRHGMAIMAEREGLSFEHTIRSDCAPLHGLVHQLIRARLDLHCLRDLTRGGLGTVLVELAQARSVHIHMDATSIPVQEEVRAACELLGLDPLFIANEGCMVVLLPKKHAAQALELLKQHPLGASARCIGEVAEFKNPGLLTMKSEIGATRIVDMLSGEQLPRIC